MNWKEFKEQVEKEGATDDSDVAICLEDGTFTYNVFAFVSPPPPEDKLYSQSVVITSN